VVYACLAETIVLALEGRFENFTVGRAIEWQKVREIYGMGLKHGMKLAAISGVTGVFTDDDIARVRELALKARAKQERARRRATTAPAKTAPAPHRKKGAETPAQAAAPAPAAAKRRAPRRRVAATAEA
jgi:Mg-chelatase subunit ChlI